MRYVIISACLEDLNCLAGLIEIFRQGEGTFFIHAVDLRKSEGRVQTLVTGISSYSLLQTFYPAGP